MLRTVMAVLCLLCLTVTGQQKTTFNEVTKKLDAKADFYNYTSTNSLHKEIKNLIDTLMISVPPQEKDQAMFYLEMAKKANKILGLNEITGMGSSIKKLENGQYRMVSFVHHHKGKGKGLIWRLGGTKALSKDALNSLPADTLIATHFAVNFKEIISEVSTFLKTNKMPPFLEMADKDLVKQGMSIDKIVSALTGEIQIIVTGDRNIKSPMELQGAFAIKLNNNDDAKNLSAFIKDMAKKTKAPMQVIEFNNWLYFAHGQTLINNIKQAAKGTNQLVNSKEFKKLSSLANNYTSFAWVSGEINEIIKAQMKMMKLDASLKPYQNKFKDEMMEMFKVPSYFSVTQKLDDGLLSTSLSTEDPVKFTVVAVVGVASAMLVPALSKARAKSKMVSDKNNIKNITLSLILYSDDNDDKLPKDLSILWKEDYLSFGKSYVAPGSNTPAPKSDKDIKNGQTDYIYLANPKKLKLSHYGSDKALIMTKPGIYKNYVNVGYGDGHVKGFNYPANLGNDYKEILKYLVKIGAVKEVK